MGALYILDPNQQDEPGRFRGAGRFIQLLRENLAYEAKFIADLKELPVGNKHACSLLIPFFSPFQKPPLVQRLAQKQILVIFDVIPLKYPAHFPAGIKGAFNLWRNKSALKYYDRVITISEQAKKDIITYLKIPAEKITVIYPTVSKVFLNPQRSNSKILNLKPARNASPACLAGESQFCLYVGDVNWNKNLVNLARAIKIANVPCVFVGKNFEDTNNEDNKIFARKFLFQDIKHHKNFARGENETKTPPHEIGRGSLLSKSTHAWQKEFRDFLTEIGDDRRFLFAGYRSDNELIKLYQQSLCNILLSRDEGFGFSYLEASTLGCPSLLSDVAIFHETAGEAGFFANPDDPDDIGAKIKQIFTNTALRNNLTFKAQQRAKYFSLERFQKEMLKTVL